MNHSVNGTPRTKVESPKSLKNIPVKQISFDDSMNLKGSKTSLSSVGLQFTIDPGLVDSNHTTSSASSRKSSLKSIIIDKIKIVKRVNSESECACQSGSPPAVPPNGWRTRSVSLASSCTTSNANNPNHIFVRSISKLKLRNDSSFDANSQISLPRFESHHSSSDEDWFEQVEEKIIAIAGPDSSERGKKGKTRKTGTIVEDSENFGSTSCFRLPKYQGHASSLEDAPSNNNAKPAKSSNSKLTNIMNALRKQHRNSIIREEDAEKLGASATLGESREKSEKVSQGSEVEKSEKENEERTDDELIESGKRKKKKRKKRKETEEGERRKTCDPCCSVS